MPIFGLYRRLRALMPGRKDWYIGTLGPDVCRGTWYFDSGRNMVFALTPLISVARYHTQRETEDIASYLNQANYYIIRPDKSIYDAPVRLLNLSVENDRWNKMALAISERQRRAWPFDPADIKSNRKEAEHADT